VEKKIGTGKLALLVMLGSETVFFLTVLMAYAALRDRVSWSVPRGPYALLMPSINTAILLTSALGAHQSNVLIRRGNLPALRLGLLITLLLGLLFVVGQIYEFDHAGLQIDDQAFGGVFFSLIGFHAVHVLAGVVFLSLNLMRCLLGDFASGRHEAIELGSWFWYYVTAVWLVIFAALYLV
jgi:heme/copper-type cytochrome/quinol oxidase subunit 3